MPSQDTDEHPAPGPSTGNTAFRLLSDETRLRTLQVLWEAHPTETPMGFAELRDRLGVEDPGRLNYHLNQLMEYFLRRTDEGYELNDSGMRIVRMLIAGTAIDEPEVEPVPVDISCWYCGGQPELRYEDGWRYLECRDCDARCVESFSPGVISKNEFPPSGLRNRTPNEINEADRIWGAHRRASVMDGVCPGCAGDMPVTSIEICEDHEPDWDEYQFCEHCGSIFWMRVSHVCEGCKYEWRLPTLFYPTREPAVTAFYHDHGIDFDLATHEQRAHLLDFEEELVSEDPIRIRISISLEGDVLELTYDSEMAVQAVERLA